MDVKDKTAHAPSLETATAATFPLYFAAVLEAAAARFCEIDSKPNVAAMAFQVTGLECERMRGLAAL